MLTLNDTTPAAPGGGTNVKWQSDSNGNVSAYTTGGGAITVNGTANHISITGSPVSPGGTLTVDLASPLSLPNLGADVLFNTDNTNNIGASGATRPKNVYVAGSVFTPKIDILGATSGDITIQGAAAAGTWTLTLPTGAGSPNFVLKTDGTGITSWVALSSLPSANASQIQSVNVSGVAPQDGQSLIYVSANNDWEPSFDFSIKHLALAAHQVSGGNVLECIGVGGAAGTGHWNFISASTVAVNPTATEAFLIKNSTSSVATSATVFGGSTTSNMPFTLGRMKRFRCRIGLAQTTNVRVWIGLSDQGTGAVGSTDTFPGNFVGFRYSTHAGDTKYMCVTQTAAGSSTKTAESTASHVDTNMHIFEFYWNGSNVIFLIDGVQVGSQNGNVPATNVQMDLMLWMDNVGVAVADAMNIHYLVIVE